LPEDGAARATSLAGILRNLNRLVFSISCRVTRSGEFSAFWAIVLFEQFFENYRRSPKF
jgi:hypothetical protein